MNLNQDTAKKLMLVERISEIVSSLNEVIYKFINEIKKDYDSEKLNKNEVALIESMHALLLSLNDAVDNRNDDNLDTLSLLTSDRGQVFDNLRLSSVSNDSSPQKNIMYITNVFQRAVWLINRWTYIEKQLLVM